MKNVYIYALIDPRNNYVRYIGKANNPKERYKNHNNASRDKNTHKRNWINDLRKNSLRPELIIFPFFQDPLLPKVAPSPLRYSLIDQIHTT